VQDFSSVAEKTGTYTAFDYADIMEHLAKRWKLSDRSDLTGEVSWAMQEPCTMVATPAHTQQENATMLPHQHRGSRNIAPWLPPTQQALVQCAHRQRPNTLHSHARNILLSCACKHCSAATPACVPHVCSCHQKAWDRHPVHSPAMCVRSRSCIGWVFWCTI
jgi:hypothetical protein